MPRLRDHVGFRLRALTRLCASEKETAPSCLKGYRSVWRQAYYLRELTFRATSRHGNRETKYFTTQREGVPSLEASSRCQGAF